MRRIADYEIHVTVKQRTTPPAITGWVLSEVSPDPSGRFIYTRHETSYFKATVAIRQLHRALRKQRLVVARTKIEHVVLDIRA